VSTAISDDTGAVEWLGIDVAEDTERSSYRPLGLSLHASRTGIALFLAALARDCAARSDTYACTAMGACSDLNRVYDGRNTVDDGRGWREQPLGLAGGGGAPNVVAHATDDDAMLLWLSDRSQAAADFAKNYLLTQNGTGNDINGNSKLYTASGLTTAHVGSAAANFIGVFHSDPRVPDLIGIVQHGVAYTGVTKKITDHGGDDIQDRNIPILVSGPGVIGLPITARLPVETTQIAPSIFAAWHQPRRAPSCSA